MNKPNGLVFLIGAGPGDPGLITLQGVKCLQQAEVVVYDRLVSPQLLNHVRPGAEQIYVGKGPDCHTLKQTDINQLLIKKALEGRIVARLKGGDPFVFGRGGEEAEALIEAGVQFEVVPGITSAVAVPAYAGIPVTHRDYTSTFAVVTGHEDPLKENSNIPWPQLPAIGTLVFLMGMENLKKIVAQLLRYGRDPSTPMALIRWGTRPKQEVLSGTLENIVDLAQNARFTSPVVIVVGDVVKMRSKLRWIEQRPLFGRRVVVTRARAQASQLTQRLEALGAEVWEFPTIKIVPPTDFSIFDRYLANLSAYQWLILTSTNGVEAFFKRLWERGGEVRDLKGINLVAIGPATAEALQERGLRVYYVPDEFRAEALAAGLAGKISPGERVLLPRAREARAILPQMLSKLGAIVDEVATYETIIGSQTGSTLENMLQQGQLDVVTFTSSSTVRNFMSLLGIKEPPRTRSDKAVFPLLEKLVIACIGPITAATAREWGLRVDVEAKQYTIGGLVEALQDYYIPK